MKDNFKKTLIPFCFMLFFNLIYVYLSPYLDYASGYNAHVGITFISGLLFGPYGAFGAILANLLYYLGMGYNVYFLVLSSIFTFAISYLVYKFWYTQYRRRMNVTKPRLVTVQQVLLFLGCIIFAGLIYAIIHIKLFYLFSPSTVTNGLALFIKFVNSSGLFGIVGMLFSKRIKIIHIPKVSKKPFNKKFYNLSYILLFGGSLIIAISDFFIPANPTLAIIEIVIVSILLFAYLTKPLNFELSNPADSITERFVKLYLIVTLILSAVIFSWFDFLLDLPMINAFIPVQSFDVVAAVLFATDEILLAFLIPSLIVLYYVERKLIAPVVSFSKIDEFIKDKKLDSDKLLEVYDEYADDKYEIGVLARSYSHLIKSNNHYIENIAKIEGEKERIKTELDIAKRIQQSNLPSHSLKDDYFTVDGYSRPAKEVGGDFFDYFELDDDNLVLMIGDASGKGVPAALLATITQTLIKQIIQLETDPSRILYSLNNQLCENNTEVMFISLWLGIYNKKTKVLTFSNAGHNPPLFNKDNKFEVLGLDSGIVLGILKDFEFKKEEIKLNDELVVYTDGITDAMNKDNEMYGETGLINFFNNSDKDKFQIKSLFDDIDEFSKGVEQFDDMTILVLR